MTEERDFLTKRDGRGRGEGGRAKEQHKMRDIVGLPLTISTEWGVLLDLTRCSAEMGVPPPAEDQNQSDYSDHKNSSIRYP